eukprot:NODE_2774_length_1344_cov_170.094185_g2636_i0.p1 GENE.NODE_2774_length_1344_cov_170.094185_g2636_i0~~NODE_2774_length_1344_cov_170.094185_g2636_i0.p1  ORF type:complete len:402 (-),score=113.07 NODE_2774_length_1344_cov_170.094185_g2636_i0:139-1293(-)
MLRAIVLAAFLAACLAGRPNFGQKTEKGCTCVSECSADVLFNEAKTDFCLTAGSCGDWSITRAHRYDYCVYPANATYEAQRASVKQSQLWASVAADQKGGSYPSGLKLAGIFTESVVTTFTNNHDYMPNDRVKYIHSVGSVCQFKFVAAPGTPYTGVFKTGGSGFIRFSAAKEPSSDNITPGYGLKIFRDGRQSANWMSMPSLDGQKSYNFFEKTFTNKPAFPSGFELEFLAKKFTQASNCPLRVGLSDAATFDANGTHYTHPKFPFAIQSQPSGAVNFPTAPYSEAELGALFARIPVGTVLFNVIGHADPNDFHAGSNPVKMGTIVTTSQCIKSTYGDDTLFFKHVWTEDDLVFYPEWLSQIKSLDEKNFCGNDGLSTKPPNM